MDQSLKRELEKLLFSEEERILGVLGVGGGESDSELLITDEVLNGGKYDISIRPHTGSVAFPLHRHSFLEIMLVISGSIVHRIDGKRITLSGGDILFLNKHAVHSVDIAEAGDVAINVIISDRFADSVGKLLIHGKRNVSAFSRTRQADRKSQRKYDKRAYRALAEN